VLRFRDEESEWFRLNAHIWEDTLPDLPCLFLSSHAGCRFCRFLREAVLRREIKSEGPVQIILEYEWSAGMGRSWSKDGDDRWLCMTVGVWSEEKRLDSLSLSLESADGINLVLLNSPS
jgi:hypothetical protein